MRLERRTTEYGSLMRLVPIFICSHKRWGLLSGQNLAGTKTTTIQEDCEKFKKNVPPPLNRRSCGKIVTITRFFRSIYLAAQRLWELFYGKEGNFLFQEYILGKPLPIAWTGYICSQAQQIQRDVIDRKNLEYRLRAFTGDDVISSNWDSRSKKKIPPK